MKKLSFIIAMAFLTLGMVACDIIEEPFTKENTGGGGGNENPEKVVKHVLLEDYTGVRCNNCPGAGELALNIQKQYDHKVIVLGVHAGFLSSPVGGYPNFMTSEGDDWYNYFEFTSNPIGTVNRKNIGGTYGIEYPNWNDEVANALQEEASVDMNATVNYDDASRKLSVEVKSKFLVEMPDTYNLTVCVVEDSIVGKQLTPDGDNPNYVHRHVFRTTMNGAWGEELNSAAVAPEEEFVKSYELTLKEAYNADQCYIVAYVANSGTKEVLQVIEKKIK